MYRVVEIEEVRDEAKDVKTFFFRDTSNPQPGQFYMIWIPQVDEFPMSISYIGELKGFTVKKIGKGTSKMHSLKKGDKLWLRGPYGKGFKIEEGKALVVGGGTGMATLAPLAEMLEDRDIIIAAKSEDEIIFRNRFKENVFFATDDGSLGFKGFATELAERMIEEDDYKIIYTCGPEMMIRKMVDIAKERRMKIQASLERYMKCGIGICDSCTINGYRVCVDGPVFSEKYLFNMDDLGRRWRAKSGKLISKEENHDIGEKSQ